MGNASLLVISVLYDIHDELVLKTCIFVILPSWAMLYLLYILLNTSLFQVLTLLEKIPSLEPPEEVEIAQCTTDILFSFQQMAPYLFWSQRYKTTRIFRIKTIDFHVPVTVKICIDVQTMEL